MNTRNESASAPKQPDVLPAHMTVNLHSHTVRCRHASGTEREYIENAIVHSFQALGFSDHTPYIFPGSYYSTFRMHPEEFEGYIDTLTALQKEYASDIRILIGVEAEYYPAWFEQLLQFFAPYPLQYMILGQHCLGNEIGDFYSGTATQDPAILRRYCQQCIDAMKTGHFLYLAHPDLLHFTGSSAVYEQEMRRLCQEAKTCDIPLEINLLGIRDHRHYPDQRFWKIAGETGCRVVTGSDAHRPQDVADDASYQTALDMIRTYHLRYEPDVYQQIPY